MTHHNLIFIKGGAYLQVKKALRQWIGLYANDLADDMTFEIFKNGHGNHIIQADEKLDNERFYYLVNYLKYPEKIDYSIDIEGFTTGKADNSLKDKNLLVYIPSTDKEGDNVYVTTEENDTYKIDFGGKMIALTGEKTYSLPTELNFENREVFRIKKVAKSVKEEKIDLEKIEKWFNPLSKIILGAFLLSYLFLRDYTSFSTIIFFLGFAVWGWFSNDYKMLRSDEYYCKCLALAFGILIIHYFFGRVFLTFNGWQGFNPGVILPFFFLVVQRPLRFAFIKIMKREPVVDKPSPSLADSVYMFVLFISTIVPVLFMPSFKFPSWPH